MLFRFSLLCLSQLHAMHCLAPFPSDWPVLEVHGRGVSWEGWPPGDVRLFLPRLQRPAISQIWGRKRLQLHSPSAEQGWQDALCGCPRGPLCSQQQRQLPAWGGVPGGEVTPRAGSAGQRMAEGQVDGKTDLLGVKMLLVGEEGPGTPPSPPTRPLLPFCSCRGARMPIGNSSAASRARTHR